MSKTLRQACLSIGILLFGSLFTSALRTSFAQEAPRPLSLDEVRAMIGTLPDTAVRRHVNEQKVDFDLTPELENEFKAKGTSDETKISQETLDAIRVRRALPKGAFEISCKPVDCDVFVDGNRVGATAQGKMKRTNLDPARVTIMVHANGYKDQSAPLQLVANSTTSYDFVLEVVPAPKPAPQPSPEPPKPAPPAAPAATNNPAPAPAPAPAAAPAGSDIVTPQVVLNKVIDACGGVAALKGFTRYTAVGGITIASKGGTTEVQVVKETTLFPRSVKWELRLSGANFTVTSSPEETWTDGDVKYKTSEMAQQLEHDIKVFVANHLALLLNRLQERDVRATLSPVPNGNGQQVLTAQTSDDKYTITIDALYRPVRIIHEAITGLQPKTDITYGHYETTGGTTLPMSMTLRYANQADYANEILYTKIDPAAQPKDSDFKRKGLLRLLPTQK